MAPVRLFAAADYAIPVDVVDRDDDYLIEAVLPGVRPEDLDVSVSDNTATIRAECRLSELEEGDYLLRERRFGTMVRSITLPAALESDRATANFEDGILHLTVPKAATAKPRRIEVKIPPSPPLERSSDS